VGEKSRHNAPPAKQRNPRARFSQHLQKEIMTENFTLLLPSSFMEPYKLVLYAAPRIEASPLERRRERVSAKRKKATAEK